MVKYEKTQVAYFENAPNRKCKRCKFFWEVDKPYACSKVRGRINPEASCVLWQPRYE